MSERTCLQCRKVFPLNRENFFVDNQRGDGLAPYCKECHKSLRRGYHAMRIIKRVASRMREAI